MQRKIWKVELSKETLKYLKKLEKKKTQRVLDRLEELEGLNHPTLHKDVRPLTGRLKGFYRLRVAEWRILFEIDRKGIQIGVHLIVSRENAN